MNNLHPLQMVLLSLLRTQEMYNQRRRRMKSARIHKYQSSFLLPLLNAQSILRPCLSVEKKTHMVERHVGKLKKKNLDEAIQTWSNMNENETTWSPCLSLSLSPLCTHQQNNNICLHLLDIQTLFRRIDKMVKFFV